MNLIHRIDFGWAVDREDSAKKHKKDTSTSSNSTSKPWPWKTLVENLQSAHQELFVIIDLINTVCPAPPFLFVRCLFGLVFYVVC